MMQSQRFVMLVAAMVALIGLADSGYLAMKHLRGDYVRCDDDCSAVLGSKYADINGVPIAGIGAIAYMAVLTAAALGALGYTRARYAVALLAFPMALISLWLIYLQAFVIHHFCQYCLLSAAITITLTILVFVSSRINRRSTV